MKSNTINIFGKLIVALIFTTSLFAYAQKASEGKPQTGLPKMSLRAGGQTIHTEVVATDETRQMGMMFRTKMGKNDGMLFVFPQLGYHAMWMRNTLINLSVAYMDEQGKILSIHEMEAFNETPHQAAGPARYALEMNAMWFLQHKVKVGDRISGLDKAPKPK
ncbi:MAG: DUF192 domain-containing protein [Pseudomonadota bacterium]